MKIINIVIAVLISISAFAQKKEKIKGNKEVIEVYKNLEPFTQLEINDGLEVFLMQTNTEGYRLKTDANLVDIIRLEVIDQKLRIYTTQKIVSSKKLEIYLTFSVLDQIILNKNSKLNGQNNFKLTNLTLDCKDGSDFELDLNSEDYTSQMSGNANGKLKLKSKSATMILDDNAYLKGSISAPTFNLTLNERSDMNIEGDSDNLNLIATGSSDIKAKNLKATNAVINASNTSDIYVYASNNLSIYAKGKSFIYVYGNPEIKVDGLNDKSKIIKK